MIRSVASARPAFSQAGLGSRMVEQEMAGLAERDQVLVGFVAETAVAAMVQAPSRKRPRLPADGRSVRCRIGGSTLVPGPPPCQPVGAGHPAGVAARRCDPPLRPADTRGGGHAPMASALLPGLSSSDDQAFWRRAGRSRGAA